MLRIKIVAVGKVREKYLQEGIREYGKRLRPHVSLEIIEVPDEPCPESLTPADADKVRQREGERILRSLNPHDYAVLLDIRGREIDSPGLAVCLEDAAVAGKSSIAFIIGGSLGVSIAVRGRADFCWSFSPLTFPHQLMRLMLLEQIYRAVKINRGEPYHK